MLANLLQNHKIILASQSPRRKELLSSLEVPFEVRVKPVDESYPDDLNNPKEIAEYIANSKAEVFRQDIQENEIIITGDTIVWKDKIALGKPKNASEASKMLHLLTGNSHEVVSSLCLLTPSQTILASDIATVHFKDLSLDEIDHYINTYKPFDKAGAYGIQEWIGHIGITKLDGSYNTVMGLPTHLLYQMLMQLVA
ncbi:Maf family nucleotide pyrophosphatase [Leeuwenhoekiella sp. A16]|uniref:Maf family nucleotide pyrophosphatase n=1 Tax=Leeuwenhoekiella sp. A16 TaxID=3141462 RepID=UPI003A812EDE